MRPSTESDEPFLKLAFESVRRSTFAALPPAQQEQMLDMQYRAQRSQYLATYPSALWWIIEKEGVPVGYLAVAEDSDIRLLDIAVLPEHQGQGTGEQAIAWLMARRKPVRLRVDIRNPAHRLYSRLGFAVIGTDGIDLQMQWNPPQIEHLGS